MFGANSYAICARANVGETLKDCNKYVGGVSAELVAPDRFWSGQITFSGP